MLARAAAVGEGMARAARFFRRDVAVLVGAGLVVLILLALYMGALATARHDYREVRQAYCAHLVADFDARNPRLRTLHLIDACIELEALTGWAPR